MALTIRINGQKNKIYFVDVYPNETIEDIINLLSKKYNKDMSNFTLDEKPIEKNSTISDLLNSESKKNLTFDVMEQQIDQKIGQMNENSSSTAKAKTDKKLDPKIQNLVDLFKFNIGLAISKDKIIEALRGEFIGALGTDPDNKERIKAAEYLINTENNYSNDISQYSSKDQKNLNKIIKKMKLPFCIVAYVYDANNQDKDKTTKNLKAFLSKK